MANEKHLAILEKGVEAWNDWRREKPDVRPDLSGLDLSLGSFMEIDFGGTDLRGCYLSGADLSDANLKDADLTSANLSGANLSGANLEGTHLREANLVGVDLRRAILYRADLREAILENANLRDADLELVVLDGAFLLDADIRGAHIGYDDSRYAEAMGARVDSNAEIYKSEDEFEEESAPSKAQKPSIRFMACHRQKIEPEAWYEMLAYIFVTDALGEVEKDFARVLGEGGSAYNKSVGVSNQTIKPGAEIMVVPEMDGVIFNPPKASIKWLEPWHRVNFRMMASQDFPGFTKDVFMDGKVSFYVGPVLISEVGIWCTASDDVRDEIHQSTADVYDAIFVSYSHKDHVIIDALEKAYRVLGMDYLRDVNSLKSGEMWNSRLLDLIEEADIFQLCWSENAKKSEYVEQEWQHALRQDKPGFIRPTYWEKPMPAPPPALADLHFSFYEIGAAG